MLRLASFICVQIYFITRCYYEVNGLHGSYSFLEIFTLSMCYTLLMSNNEHILRKLFLSFIMIIFIWTGTMKLINSPREIALFAKWGYPVWFMYLTGFWNIFFAFGLLLKTFSQISGVGLMLLLSTDIVTNIINHESSLASIPAITLILMTCLMFYFDSKIPQKTVTP